MIDEEARSEIAAHLWRYLSASANASPRPLSLDDVPLLLHSDVVEIRVRAAVAVVQALDGESVLLSIAEVLRRLPTAISFDRQDLHGKVVGRIDWPSTRLRSAIDPTVFVCRVPRRMSDLPLNRTLRAMIEGFRRAVDTTIAATADPTWGQRLAVLLGGAESLRERSDALGCFLAHPKLVRTRSARVLEPARVERLVALGLEPRMTAEDVLDGLAADWETRALLPLISRHLLEPSQDSRLFELLVAVRVVRAFEDLGFVPLPWRIIASERRPFAELLDPSGCSWKVYWQKSHWGLDLGPKEGSRYLATMKNAGAAAASLRPDLVIVPPSGSPVLIEVKYTASGDRTPESAGVIDMMAYLWDMGALVGSSQRPLGVVIAHGSPATVGVPPILVCDERASSLREVATRLLESESMTIEAINMSNTQLTETA